MAGINIQEELNNPGKYIKNNKGGQCLYSQKFLKIIAGNIFIKNL